MLTLLLAFLFSAPAQGQEVISPDKIAYATEWWVGEKGDFTKIYDFEYSGGAVIRRLSRFAQEEGGEELFIRNRLPNLEKTDELIKSERLGPGHYRFIFRAANKNPTVAMNSLSLRIPVIEDPVAVLTEPVDGTGIRHRFRDIEVENRFTVRVPWKFVGEVTHKNDIVSSDGLEVRLAAKPLSNESASGLKYPGWDLPGAEISQTIRAQNVPLKMESLRVLRERNREWLTNRMIGGALVGIPTSSGVEEISPFRWGSSFDFGYQGYKAEQRSYSQFEVGLAVKSSRRFTQNLAWNIGKLSFVLGSGSSGESSSRYRNRMTSLGLGTHLELRAPFIVGPADHKMLSFFELTVGPALMQDWFSDDETGFSRTLLSPATELALRWGLSNPKMGFLASAALTAKWLFYFRPEAPGSRILISLETIL